MEIKPLFIQFSFFYSVGFCVCLIRHRSKIGQNSTQNFPKYYFSNIIFDGKHKINWNVAFICLFDDGLLWVWAVDVDVDGSHLMDFTAVSDLSGEKMANSLIQSSENVAIRIIPFFSPKSAPLMETNQFLVNRIVWSNQAIYFITGVTRAGMVERLVTALKIHFSQTFWLICCTLTMTFTNMRCVEHTKKKNTEQKCERWISIPYFLSRQNVRKHIDLCRLVSMPLYQNVQNVSNNVFLFDGDCGSGQKERVINIIRKNGGALKM